MTFSKSTSLLLLILLLMPLTGCAAWHRASADREVNKVLAMRQVQTTGLPFPASFPADDSVAAGPEAYEFSPTVSQADGPSLFGPIDEAVPRWAAGEGGAAEFDLAGALAYALGHSREFQFQLEELYLATLDLTLERHLWSPRWIQEVRSRLDGAGKRGDFDRLLDSDHFISVTQRLPYGGEMVASVVNVLLSDLRRSSSDSLGSAVTLSGSIPLLRGAGIVAYESRIQQERDLIYAVRRFERFRRTFLVDIASSYLKLIGRKQQVENTRLSFESLKQLYEREAAYFEEGKVSLLENQRAEQNALQRENDYIDALESYGADLDRFKLILGLPPATVLDLNQEKIDVSIFEMDLDAALALARYSRLDLLTFSDRVDDARRRVKVARNGLAPDLDLDGALSVETGPDLGVADFDGDDISYSAGMVFSIPLDRKAERNTHRAALIDLERARRDYSLAHDGVSVDVRRAYRRIELERNALRIQQVNVRSNEQRLENASIRVEQGLVSNREVTDAQDALLEARNRLAQAKSNLAIAILQFARDSGALRVDPSGKWRTLGPAVKR